MNLQPIETKVCGSLHSVEMYRRSALRMVSPKSAFGFGGVEEQNKQVECTTEARFSMAISGRKLLLFSHALEAAAAALLLAQISLVKQQQQPIQIKKRKAEKKKKENKSCFCWCARSSAESVCVSVPLSGLGSVCVVRTS